MDRRERFLAFANFEPVDRAPRYARFVKELRNTMTEYLGESPGTYFGKTDTGRAGGLQAPEDFEFPDYSVYHPGREDGKDGFTIDQNGCGHLAHGFHHFNEYISPLRHATSFEEIEKYPIASNASWSTDKLLEARGMAEVEGRAFGAYVGDMYENAWQVRGYEEFLMDLLTQREWAELLLDRFCENNVRAAVAAAKAGCDYVSTGDDIAHQNGMMFQPDLWREVMKPRWAKVFAAARDIKPDIHIWYHSDGNIWDVLDDLVEIGVTILNPVQPECMDPLAVRKRFGKRLAFDGCIGTQTTFPFGTPADMRATVLELADALDARYGGLTLSPTHILEPDVPPENIVAFFKACDELAF